MKLILPDRKERVLATRPIPLDQLLLAEGINPLGVIASRDGVLITEDTVVSDDDEIRLIRIAHGG
jgi:sulfur carrier protein ThiS